MRVWLAIAVVLALAGAVRGDEELGCSGSPCTTTPTLTGNLMKPVIITKTLSASSDEIAAMRAKDDLTRKFDDGNTIIYSTTRVHPEVIDHSRPVTPVYVDHVEKPEPEASPCDCVSTCGQIVEPSPCSCACNQPKNETNANVENDEQKEEEAPSTELSTEDEERMKEGRDMAEELLKHITEHENDIDEKIREIRHKQEENEEDVQEVYDRVKILERAREAKRARMELLDKRIETLEEKLRDAIEVTNGTAKASEETIEKEKQKEEDKKDIIEKLEARIEALEQALLNKNAKSLRFRARPDYISPSDTNIRVSSMVPASLRRGAQSDPVYDYHIPKTLLLE